MPYVNVKGYGTVAARIDRFGSKWMNKDSVSDGRPSLTLTLTDFCKHACGGMPQVNALLKDVLITKSGLEDDPVSGVRGNRNGEGGEAARPLSSSSAILNFSVTSRYI